MERRKFMKMAALAAVSVPFAGASAAAETPKISDAKAPNLFAGVKTNLNWYKEFKKLQDEKKEYPKQDEELDYDFDRIISLEEAEFDESKRFIVLKNQYQ